MASEKSAPLKSIIFKAFYFFRLHERLLSQVKKNDFALVLNFHKVSPHLHPFYPAVHPRDFEEAVKLLQKLCHITSFSRLKEPRTDKKPRLIFSFDDGYYDFIEYVAPILNKYRLTANQNIVAECALTKRPPWNILLYDWFLSSSAAFLKEIKVPGLELTSADRVRPERLAAKIGHYLKFKARAERETLLAGITPAIRLDSTESHTRMMGVEEIRSLKKEFDFGCHSFTHESMGYQTQEFFENDFIKSKKFFNDELGLPLNIYAFPNGSYSDDHVQFLNKENVEFILVVDDKYASLKTSVVPRFTMYGASGEELALRALGFKNAGSL